MTTLRADVLTERARESFWLVPGAAVLLALAAGWAALLDSAGVIGELHGARHVREPLLRLVADVESTARSASTELTEWSALQRHVDRAREQLLRPA